MSLTNCPHCGHDLTANAPVAKPWRNGMHLYVTTDGKDFGMMNEEAERLLIPADPTKQRAELKLVRKDVYEASQAPKLAPNQVAPSVPTAPKVPIVPTPTATNHTPPVTKT